MVSHWRVRRLVCWCVLVVGLRLGAAEPAGPRVWVIGGLAGDSERAERYLATVTRLRDSLRQQFGLPDRDVQVLFERGAKGLKACDEGNLMRELDAVRESATSGRPLWLILVGHAATGKDEARFHIPGRDVTARQLGERLSRASGNSPLTVLLTHAASGSFLEALAGPNRCLLAAAAPGTEDNETEFPHLLAEVLASPRGADVDGDGRVSVWELERAVTGRVEAWYRERGLVRTERAVVDGNGDGRADPDPAGDDVTCARAVGLDYRR